MIDVIVAVIKADADNDDVSISMMKIMMMMYHPNDDDDYGGGTCNNCMASSIRNHCSTKHL
jgi:hypothetical protein